MVQGRFLVIILLAGWGWVLGEWERDTCGEGRRADPCWGWRVTICCGPRQEGG